MTMVGVTFVFRLLLLAIEAASSCFCFQSSTNKADGPSELIPCRLSYLL